MVIKKITYSILYKEVDYNNLIIIMEIQNKILDSLFDDIDRELKLADFLGSANFKRIMNQMKAYEAYCHIYNEVESNSKVIMFGMDQLYRVDAFKILLDRLYSSSKNDFYGVIASILSVYEVWSKTKININEIMLDLELLPEFNEEKKKWFVGIGTMTENEGDIEDVENNRELEINIENVGYLETEYRELRDRKGDYTNSQDTINAYHDWFNLSITLFSRYFDDTNSDYQKFKSVDNSGNGHKLSCNFNQIQGVYSILCDKIKNKISENSKINKIENKKIFIVHGHDNTMKLEVDSFLKQLEFETIILNNQANNGNTIIEKLEENSNVGFAIVLLSPCDEGRRKGTNELRSRARQNVILELGYFIGLLGRTRVCTLKKTDVEEPSDFTGIVYTDYDNAGGWKLLLVRELRSAGYNLDMNKIGV